VSPSGPIPDLWWIETSRRDGKRKRAKRHAVAASPRGPIPELRWIETFRREGKRKRAQRQAVAASPSGPIPELRWIETSRRDGKRKRAKRQAVGVSPSGPIPDLWWIETSRRDGKRKRAKRHELRHERFKAVLPRNQTHATSHRIVQTARQGGLILRPGMARATSLQLRDEFHARRRRLFFEIRNVLPETVVNLRPELERSIGERFPLDWVGHRFSL
jgi:hypothetical protein